MEEERERLREMLSGEKVTAATAGDVAYTPPGLPSKVAGSTLTLSNTNVLVHDVEPFEWSISRFKTQLQNFPLKRVWATKFVPPEIFPMCHVNNHHELTCTCSHSRCWMAER